MKAIKKISTIALLCTALGASTLSAKECVNLNDVKVNWTSYKTLAKVGVSGTFSDVKFESSKNSASIKDALKNSSVNIDIKNIDAKAAIKTNNILKYFVSNLKTTNIEAKIVDVYSSSLTAKITLNGKSQTIPMNYKVKGDEIFAKGVLDALDFDLAPALKVLNTEVAGHQNKGWYDIPVNFTINYSKKCN